VHLSRAVRRWLALAAMLCGLPVLGADPQTEYALKTDRLIVRLKGGAPALTVSPAARVALAGRLSAQGGESMQALRVMGDGAQVMQLARRMPVAEVAALSRRFANDPDVIEILPDRIFFPALTPNDPLFAQQWALSAANGINAPAAWDITTGANNLIIGIIDTGTLPHNGLAGRWIGGYDFVGDTNRSNDGDGRDADASDPGDWVTPAESGSGPLAGCPVTDSRWHGTAMAGVIAANANNGAGIAGINWNSKILPVRVVGKCGAYESDIADGIRWAAGIAIPSIPANPNTADVLNVSLSTAGDCSPTLQSAINEVVAAGAPIVVAAGNNSLAASGYSPANCAGVITVGAVDRNGGKPTYANFGDPIALSAPGGIGAIASGTPEQNWVLTTQNQGTTVPSGTNDFYQAVLGTSIATAHVTGVASLMLSVKPQLSPSDLKEILRNSARLFPANAVSAGSQANCSMALCGDGIVDAHVAVTAAAQFGNSTPMIAGYGNGTYGLRADGAVFHWGNGASQVTGVGGIAQLAAGNSFVLALRPEGIVLAKGDNVVGQLGDGTDVGRLVFARVSNLTGITAVAAGQAHGLARKSDGTVWGWGWNEYGQLGDGTTTNRASAVQVPGLTNITAVSGAALASYALRSDGTVWRWGDMSNGMTTSPVQVAGLSSISAIDGSGSHLLALRNDGTVWALGYNASGELGIGGTTSNFTTAAQVIGLTDVVQIRAGGGALVTYSLALKADGTVWAWGNNANGSLGDGTNGHRTTPVQVVGLTQVIAIEAGTVGQSFAIRSDGSVFAWGQNNGLLGLFNPGNTNVPTQVLGGDSGDYLNLAGIRPTPFAFISRFGVDLNTWTASNAVTIAGLSAATPISVSGGEYSIDGGSFTSASGTIANGSTIVVRVQSAPVNSATTAADLTVGGSAGRSSTFYVRTRPDSSASRVVPQAAAGDSHTLLLASDATVYASGYNGNGQLGNGATLGLSAMRAVSGLSNVVAIAVGGFHSIALRNDGTVNVWGANAAGQLGLGSTGTSGLYPVQVPGASGIAAVAGGLHHSIVLKTDGSVLAWGLNTEGQVGEGSTAPMRSSPIQVAGLSVVTAIAAGSRHNLALLANGTVMAWGANESGQLGDGTTTQRNTPVVVSGLTNVVAIAAGAAHSLAIKSDGSVVAWGFNAFGQLGDGTLTTRLTPVPVASLGSGVGLIAAGANHSLAVKAGGAMYAWGNNANSQLGNGSNANSATPVLLSSPTQVVAISGGARHTAAIDASRKLYIWGDNFFGQVGNRSGNYNPHSASLNVLRGDSVISEGTSSSSGGVGTGSNSGSSVLEIDGQATSFDFGSISAGGGRTTSGKYSNQSATENITGVSIGVSGTGFSLQSTDCPSTLTPNQQCNFTIAFNPNAAALFSGELVVNSSLVGSPERRSLSGAGVTSAAIAFSKGGIDFPPQTVGTTSAAGTVTLVNTGNATLSITSATSSLGDFAASHDCASVAPGTACAVSVTFSPTSPNGRTALITLNSNAASAPHTVTVSGTGVSTTAVPTTYTLTVAKSGSGQGTVASTSPSPAIDCGAVCTATYAAGTVVSLSAAPIAGSTFAGWSGGGCSGTGNCQVTIGAAVTVSATFNASGSVPTAPQSLTASAGNGLIVFRFNPPASDGGSPILGYRVTCTTGETTTGQSSPITLTGLVNGNGYFCSVTASNAVGGGPASNQVFSVVNPGASLSLTTVVSRKTHGAAGAFNLTIDTAQPIAGAITLEPRAIGAGHNVVFVFNGPISVTGTVSVKDAANNSVGSASAVANGHEVTVNLTGIADGQRVTVSLANVNNTAVSPSASIAFLGGDVDASRSVTSADILRSKGRAAQAANSANYLFDTDASGTIDTNDTSAVKQRAGLALP
jgi:alpha-tubulin suppressor-like RCC1 family protein